MYLQVALPPFKYEEEVTWAPTSPMSMRIRSGPSVPSHHPTSSTKVPGADLGGNLLVSYSPWHNIPYYGSHIF